MEFTYYNPVKIFHGENKLKEVTAEIKSYGSKVLLITGGESFKKSGYYDKLAKALKENDITIYEISGNRIPSLNKVREGIALVKKEKIDSVIGIGGGTCMDIAKTIAFGVKQNNDIWEYLTYQKEPETIEHLPVGTIVTIPSSGSDMNGSTQITNDETLEQAGLSKIYPNFSWQNPEYMRSISNELLIDAQLTSFVQLSLGYIGLGKSDIAEGVSLTLMNSILENLDRSLLDSTDIEARSNLMLTVNGLTSLGKQGDWCLYPINAVIQNYCKVTYKQSIMVIFPYWIKLIYNGQPTIKDYFHKMFGVDILNQTDEMILYEGLEAIFDLYRKYGLAICFSEIKEFKEDKVGLHEMVLELGEMQSIYTVLTTEKIESMITEAIYGISRK